MSTVFLPCHRMCLLVWLSSFSEWMNVSAWVVFIVLSYIACHTLVFIYSRKSPTPILTYSRILPHYSDSDVLSLLRFGPSQLAQHKTLSTTVQWFDQFLHHCWWQQRKRSPTKVSERFSWSDDGYYWSDDCFCCRSELFPLLVHPFSETILSTHRLLSRII